MPRREDAWAAALVDRLTRVCGERLQAVWKVGLTATEAPALRAWIAEGGARLGDLLRNPEDRDESLHAVPLLLVRAAGGDHGDDVVVTPDDDVVLAPNDELLLVGQPRADCSTRR